MKPTSPNTAPRILVIGDLMLDRYTWGTATRVSPEAPVLVLQEEGEEVRQGGAASVAGLLRGLGCQVELAGVVGTDSAGRTLQKLLCETGIDAEGVLIDETRPTTTKQRLEGRATQRQPQQIVRLDREITTAIGNTLIRQLLAFIEWRLPETQVVVISDYAKGVCTPELVQKVIAVANRAGVPVLVDPARGVPLEHYRGATLLKPNRQELELAAGNSIPDATAAISAGVRLWEQTEVSSLLLTLDREGMVLLQRDAEPLIVPSQPREVADITGAGDMVIATLAWGLAQGWSLRETVPWANAAAGLQVERLGVAPVTADELRGVMNRDRRTSPGKVLTRAELVQIVAQERSRGRRIVFTNGCFDLLHVGHLTCLEQAAELGDVLIVALNSDASVRRLKGPTRPVIAEADRARLLAGLACVSYVTVFDEDTPHELLRLLRPDVLVKGGSTTDIVGREVVEAYGGQVHQLDLEPGRSTTAVVQQISELQSLATGGF